MLNIDLEQKRNSRAQGREGREWFDRFLYPAYIEAMRMFGSLKLHLSVLPHRSHTFHEIVEPFYHDNLRSVSGLAHTFSIDNANAVAPVEKDDLESRFLG